MRWFKFYNGTVVEIVPQINPSKRGENIDNQVTIPQEKYFFRDIDHQGNLKDGRTFHAAGLIFSISEPSNSGKDVSVYYLNPFTGVLEYQWRSIQEIEVFESEEYEWDNMAKSLNIYDSYERRIDDLIEWLADSDTCDNSWKKYRNRFLYLNKKITPFIDEIIEQES